MHFCRRLGRLALALVAGAFAAPPLLAQSRHLDANPSPEVTAVDFTGVSARRRPQGAHGEHLHRAHAVPHDRVSYPFCRFTPYRGFEERHVLNRQEFQRDVIRIRVYFYRIGYREATVDTTVTVLNEKQVSIRFDVHEGPPTMVADVNVAYDSTVIPAKRERQLILVHAGERLNLFRVDSTRVDLQNELWERGFADALIDTSTVVDAPARTARVRFQIVPNRVSTVGDVTIQGTEHVTQATVQNTLNLRVPATSSGAAQVLESQRNLYESNLFRLAVLDVPQTFDSVKAVNVLLRESPLREARASFGFNTVDYLQAEGRFTHYNMFGGARKLEISGTVSNLLASNLQNSHLFRTVPVDTSITGDANAFLTPNWQAAIELSQPAWLQRPRNALSVGVFAQRHAVPSGVIDRSYGANAAFTRSLAVRAPASLQYSFEVTRVEAGGPYFCVNFGVCDAATINTLRSHERLSPIAAQIQVDRSDQPLNATRGYTAHIALEHASTATLSDYQYNRLYGDYTVYARPGWKAAVLAAHLRAGFVRALGGGINSDSEPVLHPRKRFYAGGAQSVRGFGENMLGPRVLTLPRGYLLHSKTATGAPCDVNTPAIRLCNPNFITDSSGASVGDDKFTPAALGGTSLLEGSVEYRFPLPITDNLQGAVFIDGAAVGERALDNLGSLSTLTSPVRGAWAISSGIRRPLHASSGGA